MYFNPNCFSQEAFGTLGNFGREGLCRIPIARPSISFGRPNTGMEGEMQRKAYGNPKEVCPSQLPLQRQERQRLLRYLLRRGGENRRYPLQLWPR
jgi:hypothetical protein